ncbi:MAG: helix-turn-helix domain-containing protein, partial [Turneriella sp.]|nr:helix-turn-helix domain-containing protein [Turneriella sp.]
IWQHHLEPLGRFGETWYFSAKSDLSPSFVEEQFRRAGMQVKIVKSAMGHERNEGFAAAN